MMQQGNSKSEVGLSQNWPADCGLWAMPSRQPRRKLRKKRVSNHVACTEKEEPFPAEYAHPTESNPDFQTRSKHRCSLRSTLRRNGAPDRAGVSQEL